MNARRNRKMDSLLVHIPQLKISWCLKISVLLGLSGYMAHIVYHGPLCSLLRNSTVIRKNELNTEGTNRQLYSRTPPSTQSYIIHALVCIHICMCVLLCEWTSACMFMCVNGCMRGSLRAWLCAHKGLELKFVSKYAVEES